MVRIDQLPPPRGSRDATREGIQDYMAYAARVMAGEEEMSVPNFIERRASSLSALTGYSMLRTRPCELDGVEDVPLDGWWGDASEDDPRILYERFIDACRLWVEATRKRDGRKFAYFRQEVDGSMPLKHFANFVRSAKYQKLMPHW